MNIQLTKSGQLQPTDLIRFEWETTKEVDLPTEEDVKRIIERDKKIWPKYQQ